MDTGLVPVGRGGGALIGSPVAEPLEPVGLTSAVRSLLGPGASVESWSMTDLSTPASSRARASLAASTRGVTLVQGTALVGGVLEQWSLVLKTVTGATGQAEAAVYGSGTLQRIRGLRAPRCLGVNAARGSGHEIWLETLEDRASWTFDRFRVAARAAGIFAAHAETAGGLPSVDRGPVDLAPHLGAAASILDGDTLSPALAPGHVVNAMRTAYDQRDRLIEIALRPPVACCHGDFQRRNLFGIGPGGTQTVAIDWARAGRAPLGWDVVVLAHQALVYFDLDERVGRPGQAPCRHESATTLGDPPAEVHYHGCSYRFRGETMTLAQGCEPASRPRPLGDRARR